jgi:hypothetical protein
MGCVGNATPRPPRERDTVPIVEEAGWVPGLVWACAENLAHTGTRSPDRPNLGESLYRLCYPGPFFTDTEIGESAVDSFAAYKEPGDYQR